MLLLIVSTVAMSTYPFDPRQALSAVLIVYSASSVWWLLRVCRNASRFHAQHVPTPARRTGAEFWFKIVGFGLAPLLGCLPGYSPV